MNAPSIAVTSGHQAEVLERARLLVRALAGEVPAPTLDDRIVELAFAEGLAPWLGARVAQGRASVPLPWKESLAWEHQMCLAANLVRERVAGTFVERCRQAALPVVWLKGMALIQGIVGKGDRSMIDADVLVPSTRWEEACRIAAALPGSHEWLIAGRHYTGAHDYVRAFALGDVTIEVHRNVCESTLFAIDHEGREGLFGRATRGVSGAWRLDEGDLFLTLVAHAAKHTYELPLRSFLDGLVLLRRGGVHLDLLFERAKRWRMKKAFQLWLRALHALAPEEPTLSGVPVGDSSNLMTQLWSRTNEASAWQRFLRLAWIMDRPADWAGHVATRIGFRVGDIVQARRGAPSV